MKIVVLALMAVALAQSQTADLSALNNNHTVLDAHNCYPYERRWADRIDRALATGYPVGIEQDLAWYIDPHTRQGRVVVTHKAQTDGSEPALKDYFFERVRPMMEQALRSSDQTHWPLVVVHFDFKDNQAALLKATWQLLQQYQDWITTAPKTADPHQIAPFRKKPLLVLTEDPDAQEEIFFKEVPVGAPLLLFGSAHTHLPDEGDSEDSAHLLATTAPEKLLPEPATDYRRWWNNSWHIVEEGGQTKAGAWTDADDARLRALVDHAHRLGYWIRFYTLDGFDASLSREKGWFLSYNFGTLAAAQQRWDAASKAGVDFIATDQYEDLRSELQKK